MGFIKDSIRPARLPIAVLLLLPAAAEGQNLRNSAFNIQYGDEGIVSLRRVNDVADTEYIANGGALGPVVARYRTSPQGDWRAVSHLKLTGEQTGNKVQYHAGELLKTLAAQSDVSASEAVSGLSTVNDGAVAPIGGGRGGRGAPPVIAAIFQGGADGGSHWIQYVFPKTETVSEAAVYWAGAGETTGRGQPAASYKAPRSWRLLYKGAENEWHSVQATAPYGAETSKFNAVKFAPVAASAMRLEFDVTPNTEAGWA
jgi:hypothetical protein